MSPEEVTFGEEIEQETPEPGADRPPRAPHRWLAVAIGSGLILAAMAVCAFLVLRLLSMQPTDFRAETRKRAAAFERMLRAKGVPEANIAAHPEALVENGEALWTEHVFQVLTPPSMSAGGVAALIAARMPDHGVGVERAESEDSGAQLVLSFGGLPFAAVHVTEPEPPQKADYYEATRVLAQRVAEALDASRAQVAPVAVEDREDDAAMWTHTAYDVTAPPDGAPDGVAQRVKAAVILAPSTLVFESAAADGAVQMRIVHQEREAVIVNIAPPAAPTDEARLPKVTAPKMAAADPEPRETPASKTVTPAAPPLPEAKYKAAIILDDGGYGGALTEDVLVLDKGLTLAILPDTPHATDTARRAAAAGFEIMLHLPMAKTDFANGLTAAMDAPTLRAHTEAALAQVPGAAGVNNHAGSVFTADEAAVSRFMQGLRGIGGLYFVDSRTSADTKAYAVARRLGVPAVSRDVFLDHENTPEYIKAQFALFIDVVKGQGSAVAIGHFRRTTVGLLPGLLPQLAQHGIALVPVSELVQ